MINLTRLNFTASARRLLFLVFFFISGTNRLFAEGEIIPFDENFALNFYGNFNIVNFASKENRHYTSASPWSIGLGIRYKNISGRLFLPLWFDNNPFDIQLNSYYEKIYYELFFRQYKNFYRDQDDGGDKHPVSGFDILSTGILAGWIQNNKRHSLGSVYNLDKKQTESSGSFLYGFGVFYNTKNSITPNDVINSGDKTLSPWIYSEIAMTNLVRQRKPEEHRMIKSMVRENFGGAEIKVEYDINIKKLPIIDADFFKQWRKNDFSDKYEALDYLYRGQQRRGI
jgi:hypothetical protein